LPTTIKQILVGKARDPMDPRIFHTVTLAAFLAWVGLGADGLSSSAYGPEEAFKALGDHAYLALFLALLTAVTVCVISLAYTKVIELFPAGGGGYLVATKLLGARLGVVSGCALVVDYVLTISISIASGCDQLFSLLPPSAHHLKFTTEVVVTLALIVLNLRGLKESITVLVPIFLLFLVTHFSLIMVTLFGHLPELPRVFGEASHDAAATGTALGWAPLLLIMMRAYSLGGGTYTGIEAVSNSVQLLREPRVPNAKRTMLYMAASLAFTAGGIIIGYLLVGARPHPGRTMNAVYAQRVFGDWAVGGLRIGPVLAALGTLMYTRGAVSKLVVMYSINVFLTFTLTLLGMLRYWLKNRGAEDFKRNVAIHGGGLVLCSLILCVTVYEKFGEGGWLTVVVTASFVTLAFLIRRHYARIRDVMRRIDETLLDLPVRAHEPVDGAIPRDEPVAVMLVSGFSGMGIHTVLSVQNLFPHQFKSYVFVSVGVIDSENFKGAAEIEALKKQTEEDLQKYVAFARRLGFSADYRYDVGTEAVEEVVGLCEGVRKDYPRSIFFLGQLVFENDRFYYRFLHNETAFAIQRRLQFAGLQAVVLPIRVLERVTRGKKARAA